MYKHQLQIKTVDLYVVDLFLLLLRRHLKVDAFYWPLKNQFLHIFTFFYQHL